MDHDARLEDEGEPARVIDDIWDPNTWNTSHEHRIYVDEHLQHYAVVDANIYPHLVQWLWSIHNRKRYERTGALYLRRTLTTFHAPDSGSYESPIHGYTVRNRNRTAFTRFLHVEVLLWNKVPQPTPEHTEGDHINRQPWDCRLRNLRWATRREQVLNSSANESLVKARARRWL